MVLGPRGGGVLDVPPAGRPGFGELVDVVNRDEVKAYRSHTSPAVKAAESVPTNVLAVPLGYHQHAS